MKIIYFYIILVLLLSFPVAVFANSDPKLDEGIKFYYNKDWEKAKSTFQEILTTDPLNSLVLSYYFSCFLWTDTVKASVTKAEEEYIKNPDKIENLVKMGFAYYAMSQVDEKMENEARDQFKEIIALNPSIAAAHTGLGMLYNDKRMTPRAKAEFNKALDANPQDIIALELMGVSVMLDDSKPQESINYFQKIIQLVPSYPDAYFYMGSAYYKMGNYNEAIPYLTRTSDLDPLGIGKGYFSTILLGDIYVALTRYDDAILWYEKALKINPYNVAAQVKLDKASKAKEEKH